MKTHPFSSSITRSFVILAIVGTIGGFTACEQPLLTDDIKPQQVHINLQKPKPDTINHQFPRTAFGDDDSTDTDLPVIEPMPKEIKEF